MVELDLRTCRATSHLISRSQTNVRQHRLELGRIGVESRQRLGGIPSADHLEAGLLQSRLEVEQDHRFIFDDQNSTCAHPGPSQPATATTISAPSWFHPTRIACWLNSRPGAAAAVVNAETDQQLRQPPGPDN